MFSGSRGSAMDALWRAVSPPGPGDRGRPHASSNGQRFGPCPIHFRPARGLWWWMTTPIWLESAGAGASPDCAHDNESREKRLPRFRLRHIRIRSQMVPPSSQFWRSSRRVEMLSCEADCSLSSRVTPSLDFLISCDL